MKNALGRKTKEPIFHISFFISHLPLANSSWRLHFKCEYTIELIAQTLDTLVTNEMANEK